uniref:ELMO domain-containing protein n=1 Tax=Syphacia muris TaxID=451379 RepID=A0A0N5ASP3_9BILA
MSSNFLKPLREIDIRLPESTVKGAVQLDRRIGLYLDNGFQVDDEVKSVWSYVTLDKKSEVISNKVKEICKLLNLPDSDKDIYALKFEDTENDGAFLTDENRCLIKQGFILILTASPEQYAISILSRFKECTANIKNNKLNEVLFELVSESIHAPFANEFQRIGGIDFLIDTVQNGNFADSVTVNTEILQSLLNLMKHPGAKEWSDVPDDFIKKVSDNISGRAKQEDNGLLQFSLCVVDNVLNSKSNTKAALVMELISFECLIRHLEKSDERVLHSALRLMNSLYAKVTDKGKITILQHLHSIPFRKAVENSVLRKPYQLNPGVEQQLIIVQRIFLDEVKNRALCKPNEEDVEVFKEKKVFVLEQIPPSSTSVYLENNRDDCEQFLSLVAETPPGMLAVDLVSAPEFGESKTLKNILMENLLGSDDDILPIALVSVELVKILIDVLNIIQQPDKSDRLHIMLFKSQRPFEELFMVSLSLFYRTWHEMQARKVDVYRVLSVVRKQVTVGFKSNSETIALLEKLLAAHSYHRMQAMWEEERSQKEAEDLNNKSVKELRSFLHPSIQELIKRNRKNVLKNGFTFRKLPKNKSVTKESDSQQYWHWKLDMSETTLVYWDCTPDNALFLDPSTSTKISVSDLKNVTVCGKNVDSTHTLKSKKRLGIPGLTLEVGREPETYFLAANEEQVINAWYDGLNALIGSNKLSAQAREHAEMFLNIEVKMRLLELNNIPESLIIPPLPEDMDWVNDKVAKPN